MKPFPKNLVKLVPDAIPLAASGPRKPVALKTKLNFEKCLACNGKGRKSNQSGLCVPCKGTGRKLKAFKVGYDHKLSEKEDEVLSEKLGMVYNGPEDNPRDDEESTKEEYERWEETQQPDYNPDKKEVPDNKPKVQVRTKQQQAKFIANRQGSIPTPKLVEKPTLPVSSKVVTRQIPKSATPFKTKVSMPNPYTEPNLDNQLDTPYEAIGRSKKSPVVIAKSSHLIVDALAGTGKTFTIVEGVKRLMGQPTKGVVGTEQQEAIWTSLKEGNRPTTVLVAAFNKLIANELKKRLPAGKWAGAITSMTLHAFGKQLICKYGQKHQVVKNANDKTTWAIEQLMQEDSRELWKTMSKFMHAMCQIVTLCKIGLESGDEECVRRLIAYHNIELKEQSTKLVVDLVPQVLQLAKDRTDYIDFGDMLWFPIIQNYDIKKVDLMLVDERQDMNKAQQELAIRASRRLVLVGDVHQSIYGFAGADVQACQNMEERLSKTALGCKVMPLTYTRRCCKAIVRLVTEKFQQIPLEALPDAPEGEVTYGDERDFCRDLKAGDMVVCRINAPLIKHAMSLLKKKIKVKIQGRDVGEDLVDVIHEMDASNVEDLIYKLDTWYDRKASNLRNRKNIEAQLIQLQDQHECLMCFTEGAYTIKEVTDTIHDLFKDEGTGDQWILFASIHKAKGLEANRVFFLQYNLCPHKLAKSDWQIEQEYNLMYVAFTRGKVFLQLVKGEEKKKERMVQEDE